MSSSRAHRSHSYNNNSSNPPGRAISERDSNEPQFALPGDPASASRGGGGRMQFGAAGSGGGVSLFKERETNKFTFGGGGGGGGTSSIHPPPSQQQPSASSSSSNQHQEDSQQHHHHQHKSRISAHDVETPLPMRPSQKQEQDQPEQDVEEEIVVVEEAIIFVEKNGKQGRGVHHHHQQEQQEEEEEHQQHDDESPPPSSRSRRFQDQSNSDYVDDEEEDREEEDGARRRGEDGEDEYIDRRSWRQEPEAEMEAEHEQQQEEQEQEQEMELDDEAGEQGAGAGRARSGEEEVGSNIRGGGAKSEAPYSKLYIKIAQSDLYAEQHKAFDEKWGAVDADDEEKWVQGGDDLVKKAKGVLDRVRDHVMERMKLYTTIDTHIVEHKSELVSNATTLDATASQLSSWGNHIVSSVNIGGDGKQPSSSA